MLLDFQHLKKIDRGAAHVFIIVVIGIFVAFLIPALSSLSLTDLRSAAQQEKSTQAYYVARAGAEAVLNYIINNPDELNADDMADLAEVMIDSGPSQAESFGNGMGFFTVEVTEVTMEGKEGISILSTGIVDNASKSVRVVLNVAEYPDYEWISGWDPFPTVGLPYTVFFNSFMNLINSNIDGDVGVNIDAATTVNIGPQGGITGFLYVGPNQQVNWHRLSKFKESQIQELEETIIYPMPPPLSLPSDLSQYENFSGESITDDGEYNNITVAGNLTIDVEGDSDRIIIVDTLDVKEGGNIIVNRTGMGRLRLYVRSNFNIEGNTEINQPDNGQNDTTDALVVFYKGQDELSITGNQKIYGNFFVEDANVAIGGDSSLTGNIITGGQEVKVHGTPTVHGVIYAPQAAVRLLGTPNITGAVVCDEYHGSGVPAQITKFDSSFETSFPEFIEDIPTEEIITEVTRYTDPIWMSGK